MGGALTPGTMLAQYEVISLLGAGGMGEVYLAEDTRLGRKVALKVLPRTAATAETEKRFIREARSVAALDHPNICTIYEVGQDDGQSYFAMQYVDGETLADWLDRGSNDLRARLDIAVQVASALEAAHQHGVIHRDIKPPNILITAGGQAKVVDFGLARLANAPELTEITRTGTVAGTYQYMSPEQLRGDKLDARTDIFSFAVMLYEMFGGHRPFDSDSPAATITSILFSEPPPFGSSDPILRELESLIRGALQKDLTRRPQTMGLVRAEMERLRKSAGRGSSSDDRTAEMPAVSSAGPASPASKVRTRPLSSDKGRAINSVAVFPRSSGDAENYLLEAVADAIIAQLSRVPTVRILSRATSFRFQEGTMDFPALGRDLNIAAAVTVEVHHSGENLQFEIAALRTQTGEMIWNSTYNTTLDEMDTIGEQIGRDLVGALHLTTTRKRARKQPALPAAARDLFFRARHLWNQRTGTMAQALQLYKQVVELAPSYAPGYSGLADTYNLLGFLEALPPRDTFPRARAAAARALELDPTAAEPLAALGYVAAVFDWKWREADNFFAESIARNPNYGSAHHWRGVLALRPQGRFEEALASVQKAEELDPLAPIMTTGVGLVLYLARRYEEALKVFGRLRAMEPDFPPNIFYSGMVCEQLNRYDEALLHFRTVLGLGLGPLAITALGHCYAKLGRSDEARQALADLDHLASRRYVSSYSSLIIHTGLGETDLALDRLDRAFEEHASWISMMGDDPRVDPLRSHPRFRERAAKHGFEIRAV